MKKQDIHYQIVRASSIEALEARVNAAILDGWIPQGSVSLWGAKPVLCAQAMFKPVKQ